MTASTTTEDVQHLQFALKKCPSCTALQDAKKEVCPNCGFNLIDVAIVNKIVISKTKWLKIWTYVCLPFSGVNNIYISVLNFTASEISFGLMATIFTIVQLSTAFGLHYRKIWAWRLNWVALAFSYYGGVTLPRFIKQSYGYEEPDIQLVLRMIIGLLTWIWPNYVYWKKRKELFTQ